MSNINPPASDSTSVIRKAISTRAETGRSGALRDAVWLFLDALALEAGRLSNAD